jgi:hypothetical protein
MTTASSASLQYVASCAVVQLCTLLIDARSAGMAELALGWQLHIALAKQQRCRGLLHAAQHAVPLVVAVVHLLASIAAKAVLQQGNAALIH